jgi:hypothetical protein
MCACVRLNVTCLLPVARNTQGHLLCLHTHTQRHKPTSNTRIHPLGFRYIPPSAEGGEGGGSASSGGQAGEHEGGGGAGEGSGGQSETRGPSHDMTVLEVTGLPLTQPHTAHTNSCHRDCTVTSPSLSIPPQHRAVLRGLGCRRRPCPCVYRCPASCV